MSSDHTEQLVQLSRRQLWLALVFIFVFGTIAIVQLAFPGQHMHKLWSNSPVVIIVALASLSRAIRRVKEKATASGMRVVLDDELRQASLQRAYRNAFFAMLVLQPLMALAVTTFALANSVAVMAAASALGGAVAMLGSFLYYDR